MFSIEGKLINHDSEFYGRVEINTETGLVEKVGTATGAADLVCGEECLVFPGFIDLHVHAREDTSGRQNYKEDFKSASEAALNGGIAHFCDMPNNPVAPIDDKRYCQKQELIRQALVDVTLYAGIGPYTAPLSLKVPYKAFMGPSAGDLSFTSQADLEAAIRKYAGQFVSFHCEDPHILDDNRNKLIHEQQRPPEAEIAATELVLYLIENYRLKGKLCHYSTRLGLKKIRQAKIRGVDITCEAVPHHLYFDESVLSGENRRWLQTDPPLRTKEDRLELIEALRNGEIDYLATDHAPHTREEKQRGMSGVPHLDTFGSFTTWLMKDCAFTPQDIARVACYNPGRFVNNFSKDKFGRIKEGYVGSLAVIDLEKQWLVTKEDLKTKCGWSPFEGQVFPGRVKYTIIRGKVHKIN